MLRRARRGSLPSGEGTGERLPLALVSAPITFTRAVVAASGTSVGPSAAVPDNCHTILVTNPSSTIVVLVGIAVPPAALTAGVNAQRVPPGMTLTLAVGSIPQGMRGPIDQAQSAGSGLAFDSIGGAVTPEVTYLNHLGA